MSCQLPARLPPLPGSPPRLARRVPEMPRPPGSGAAGDAGLGETRCPLMPALGVAEGGVQDGLHLVWSPF